MKLGIAPFGIADRPATRREMQLFVLIAELEAERDELKRLLPDHCYRCNKSCLYAGAESETGASRCPVCLLEDAKDDNKELRQEVERLKTQADPGCGCWISVESEVECGVTLCTDCTKASK